MARKWLSCYVCISSLESVILLNLYFNKDCFSIWNSCFNTWEDFFSAALQIFEFQLETVQLLLECRGHGHWTDNCFHECILHVCNKKKTFHKQTKESRHSKNLNVWILYTWVCFSNAILLIQSFMWCWSSATSALTSSFSLALSFRLTSNFTRLASRSFRAIKLFVCVLKFSFSRNCWRMLFFAIKSLNLDKV